jgi:hypothetical protein
MSEGSGEEGHGLVDVTDAEAFLSRLTRLDPMAVVRLRKTGVADVTALWAHLPWTVLATRTVSGTGPADATVSAAALLAELARGGAALPRRCDEHWRWPLPTSAGQVVETMPGADVRRVAAAAAGTLRTAAEEGVSGRAVGQRALREALLDHVAIVVEQPPPDTTPKAKAEMAAEAGRVPEGRRIEVPQRLVQAVVRMGFLGAGPARDEHVQVRVAGRWIGLAAPYGAAWLLPASQFTVGPVAGRPTG